MATNRRGRATRAELRTAVDEVLAAHGLDLTVEAVAAAAGVTRQTVHRHLGDREALLTDALLRASARVVGDLAAVLDAPEPFAWRLREAVVTGVREARADPVLMAVTGGNPGTAWPSIDRGGRFVEAARTFLRPYLVEAEAAGVPFRTDVDRTLDWLMRQILLQLLVASAYGDGDDAVRADIDLFVLPAILTEPTTPDSARHDLDPTPRP